MIFWKGRPCFCFLLLGRLTFSWFRPEINPLTFSLLEEAGPLKLLFIWNVFHSLIRSSNIFFNFSLLKRCRYIYCKAVWKKKSWRKPYPTIWQVLHHHMELTVNAVCIIISFVALLGHVVLVGLKFRIKFLYWHLLACSMTFISMTILSTDEGCVMWLKAPENSW